MGAHLQTLTRLPVSTEVTGERVLADGQKRQHTATADLNVAPPDRLRVRLSSARSEGERIYGGIIYPQCGSTWYQPQGTQYVVISPPYSRVRRGSRAALGSMPVVAPAPLSFFSLGEPR